MSGLVTLLPFILIFVVMYFLMVRPQQKRSQEQRRLISSLEPGDEVVTIGGVFGDIVEIQDAEVILEVYDGTQLKFLRSAIARKVVPAVADDEIDEVDDDYDDDSHEDHELDIEVSEDDVAVKADTEASPEGNGEASAVSKAKSKSKSDDTDD